MIRTRPLILALTIAIATVARARQRDPAATAPTTLPIDAVAIVAQLVDHDPATRAAARSALMSLDAAALPALRAGLADVPLTRAEASGVREAVEHVYLTGKHRFAGGGSPGYMGVARDNRLPPTVLSRRLGWDAYRAMEDGDVIVALRPVGKAAPTPMVPVATWEQLLATLAATSPGDHVAVRVMRNGRPLDVDVRLAVAPAKLDDGVADPLVAEADKYWLVQFAPRLRIAAPTTRPVQ